MHVKVVVPNNAGRELLVSGKNLRTDFEKIVQNRQFRFLGWMVTTRSTKDAFLSVSGEG
jgi:hypothetical protein